MDPKKLLSNTITQLWNQPSQEYLLVYHPQGNSLHKELTFNNLLRLIKINPSGSELYCQPIVIFACLGANCGALNSDTNQDQNDFIHNYLDIKKIGLNKYQEYSLRDGEIIIKLKTPEIITPESINNFKFEHLSLKRPPQMRRILKEYFKLIKVPFDEQLLFFKLEELFADNSSYSFEDADEIFIRYLYHGTQFERIPEELKEIIISYVSDSSYINPEDLYAKSNSILNLVENMTENIMKNGDTSILDIFNNLNSTGDIKNIVNTVHSTTPDNNFVKFLTSEIGIKNIFETIKNKSKTKV